MDKEEIKKIQRTAQKLLEQLQDENASFMFVGNEGNCFTIGGEKESIEAQIIFAMCRYPVVKDIIKKCATRFDELDRKFGDNIRNVTMEHLIEQNSGN